MIPAELAEGLANLGQLRKTLEDQRHALDELLAGAILKARDAGASLAEVAELVGLSRAGVDKAERRAREGGQ